MSSKARLLLLLPVVDAILIIGVFLYPGGERDSDWAALLAYNCLPPAALAALVVLTAGLWPRGMPVTAATCVLFSGLLAAALLATFSSSTGALLLLFLPIEFCLALAPFVGLGIVVHWLRGRRAVGRGLSVRESVGEEPSDPESWRNSKDR